MRRYRRNGTPIGDRKVYVVMPGFRDPHDPGPCQAWEIKGLAHWEEVADTIPLEAMTGAFGRDFDPRIAKIICPGANLKSSSLYDGSFEKVDLRDADLRRCDISATAFTDSDFRGANLSSAVVDAVRFSSCDLRGCRFYGKIRACSFFGCDLRNVDMSECEIYAASFYHCDLRGTRMSENVVNVDFGESERLPSDPPIASVRETGAGRTLKRWHVVDGRMRETLR
jgi:hypothetical protein